MTLVECAADCSFVLMALVLAVFPKKLLLLLLLLLLLQLKLWHEVADQSDTPSTHGRLAPPTAKAFSGVCLSLSIGLLFLIKTAQFAHGHAYRRDEAACTIPNTNNNAKLL